VGAASRDKPPTEEEGRVIKLSERTRRGLREAIGTPFIIGALVLAFLLIVETVGPAI